MKRQRRLSSKKIPSTSVTNGLYYTQPGANLDLLPMDLFTKIVNHLGELECHILRFVSKNCYSRTHCYARNSSYFTLPHTTTKRIFFSS